MQIFIFLQTCVLCQIWLIIKISHEFDNYFSPLLSVSQGRDPEYKLKTLSKLVSMSLGTSHLTLLNCTGLWLSQQTPTHDNSLAIANQLITDYIR